MEKRVKDTFAEIDPSGAMGSGVLERLPAEARGLVQGAARSSRPSSPTGIIRKPTSSRLMTRVEPYVTALAKAGHPLYFEELNVPVPESQARWAYHNAHLMRKRFSSGDLIYFLGWFDEAWTDRVFARMHELVEGARK